MSESMNRYRALLTELLFEREAAGGELSQLEESLFVERLDQVWWQLSSAEQDIVDEELARAPNPRVIDQPALVDCAVSEGSSAAPRKPA
jgi:hypothetical protein